MEITIRKVIKKGFDICFKISSRVSWLWEFL